jgi:hypothetical protein
MFKNPGCVGFIFRESCNSFEILVVVEILVVAFVVASGWRGHRVVTFAVGGGDL